MQELLVDTEHTTTTLSSDALGEDLVSWIEAKLRPWRDRRDADYRSRWASYGRLWLGRWSPEEMSRASERSKLIAPALSEAVETNVAELEEALFGREVWFDVADDLDDQDKGDIRAIRDRLREDLEKSGAPQAMAEALQIGAVWGQMTLKLSVEMVTPETVRRGPISGELVTDTTPQPQVKWLSCLPQDLVWDPAATCVEDMLGIAHEVEKPLHHVYERSARGVYRREALASLVSGGDPDRRRATDVAGTLRRLEAYDSDSCQITEYHGKVPVGLLPLEAVQDKELSGAGTGDPDSPLIEAVVTYANGATLLRASENPFVHRDRGIVSVPWDRIPGQFIGRGLVEKGFNSQKALDAEIRSRIDSLAFTAAPMMGIDATRMQRRSKLKVAPGVLVPTYGRPSDIMEPIRFGQTDPATFQQAQALERWVQQSTGALSPASPTTGSQPAGPFTTSIVSANFRQ